MIIYNYIPFIISLQSVSFTTSEQVKGDSVKVKVKMQNKEK